MVSNDDIIAAMLQEKAHIKASSVEPQLKPQITDEEIIKNHHGSNQTGTWRTKNWLPIPKWVGLNLSSLKKHLLSKIHGTFPD